MTFSFIVPTLNEGSVLERVLHSLRECTAVPYEIVVSDGGSTDETLTIAHRIADKVIEWKEPARQNIAMGRNAGAQHASGDILVFIDADVFIPDINQFFLHVRGRFECDPHLTGLIPRLEVLPENRTITDTVFAAFFNLFNLVMNNVLKSPTAPGELQVIPADVFKKLGGYDERIVQCEDMDMFMRLGRIGKTRLDPKLLVFHTGRRAHKIGWLRLVFQWTMNGMMVKFYNRSVSKEWKVIR